MPEVRVRFERPDWEANRDSGVMAIDMRFHIDCLDSFTNVCNALKLAK